MCNEYTFTAVCAFRWFADGPESNGLLVSHGKPKSVTASILRDGLNTLEKASGGGRGGSSGFVAHSSSTGEPATLKRKRRKAMISDSDSSESEIDVEAISKEPVLPNPAAQPLSTAGQATSATAREKTPPPFYAAPPTTSTTCSSRNKPLSKKKVVSSAHLQPNKANESNLQLVVCINTNKFPVSKPTAVKGAKPKVDKSTAVSVTVSSENILSVKQDSAAGGDLPPHSGSFQTASVAASASATGKKKKHKKHKKKKTKDDSCVVQHAPLKLKICLGKS